MSRSAGSTWPDRRCRSGATRNERADVFWVRMNNSSRAWPEDDVAEYVDEHWGARR
jgi:hypothetical protein